MSWKNLKTSEKLDLGLGFKYGENLDVKWGRGVKIRLYITNDERYMNSDLSQGYFAFVPGREIRFIEYMGIKQSVRGFKYLIFLSFKFSQKLY